MTKNPLRDDGGLQSGGRAVEGETKGEYDAGEVDMDVEHDLGIDGEEIKTALRLRNSTAETDVEIDVDRGSTHEHHEELSTPQTPQTPRREELPAALSTQSTHMEWVESDYSRSSSGVGDHMESDGHIDSDEY